MKRILITGANRGLGLELTRQYAASGQRVFASCRAPQKAAALQAVAAQHQGRVSLHPLDVGQKETIAAAAAQIGSQTEGLDVLINNAAIHLGDEHLAEVQPDRLLQTLQVNAVGPVLVVQAFIDLLRNGQNPQIINISSEAGSISMMKAFRGYGYYGSKAAENMYTRALAFDPEAAGITVIAIHPGWVRTDMGGPDAHLSVAESAAGILKVAAALTPEDNGRFLTWDGQVYPW